MVLILLVIGVVTLADGFIEVGGKFPADGVVKFDIKPIVFSINQLISICFHEIL